VGCGAFFGIKELSFSMPKAHTPRLPLLCFGIHSPQGAVRKLISKENALK
jgi:hypothetical protein